MQLPVAGYQRFKAVCLPYVWLQRRLLLMTIADPDDQIPERPPLSEVHIELMDETARHARRRWPWRDLDDFRHDALWGLYLAWDRWWGMGDFVDAARSYMWWSMRNGMRTEIQRRKAFAHESMDVPTYDEIADSVTVEDQALAAMEISRINEVLKHELPIVRDAVLRNGTDRSIAARYGMESRTDRNGNYTIARMRSRFLRAYILSQATGEPMHKSPEKIDEQRAVMYADLHV